MEDSKFKEKIEGIVLKWQNGLHSNDCMRAIEKLVYPQKNEKPNYKAIAEEAAKKIL